MISWKTRILYLTVLLGTLSCGAVGKHEKASDRGPPPQPPLPPPSSSDTPKGIELPLTAGATVIGRLSASEPCVSTYAVTIGGMLHTAGQATADDEVHFSFDPHDKELATGVKYKGELTHEFDIFPKDGDEDLISSALKAGKTLKITVQPTCATGTTVDSIILVDFIDVAPYPYNPTWGKTEFLDLKSPTSFGATFAYDGSLAWQVTYTTSLTSDDLKGLPAHVHYAIYNTDAMAMAVPWQEISRDALLTGQIKVTDPLQVRRIIPNQQHVHLIFDTSAQEAAVPTFYALDIGELCKDQPTLFKNLTDAGKGCAQVTDADLGN